MSEGWPQHTRLCGYSADWITLFKSNDRDFDLCDNFICTLFSNLSFPFHLSATVDNSEWEILSDHEDGMWDDGALTRFEAEILEDFAFDGIAVHLTRLAGEGLPRSCSAVWRIESVYAQD
jgi:hypothetical protein